MLTDEGLEVAGTAHEQGYAFDPLQPGQFESGIDPACLAPVVGLDQLLRPGHSVPEAIECPFPLAFLVTTAGLVTWSHALHHTLLITRVEASGLSQLRPRGTVLNCDADSSLPGRVAAGLVAAGIAQSIDSAPASVVISVRDHLPTPTPEPTPPGVSGSEPSATQCATSDCLGDERNRRPLLGWVRRRLHAPKESLNRAPTADSRLPIWSATCSRSSFGNPFALGMILSAVRAHDGGRLRDRLELYPIRLTAEQVLDDVADAARPGVLLASNYLWTVNENLEVAARVKEISPDTLVVFGGPSAPSHADRVERFLANHPQVDVLVHGEGEATAAELIDVWIRSRHLGFAPLMDVAGLSFRRNDTIQRTSHRERIADLNVIPSPYLEGLFDHLLGSPMFWAVESTRGCPYGCTFCDWGAATMSRIRKFDLDRVKAELNWLAMHDIEAILLTDANFGILKRDVEIASHLATLRQRKGAPRSLICTFAKNSVKNTLEITKILLDAGLATEATLGFQTTDDQTLINVHRHNIKPETYKQMALEARSRNLPVVADLMLGLPGMTRSTFKADLQACCEQDVTARVFPTLALENSTLNDSSYRETHQIKTDEFEQVIATASFTEEEREEIVLLRNAFRFADHFGALRHLLRFVAHETGQREIDIFDQMLQQVRHQPSRFPVLTFAFTHSRRYLTPSFGWPNLLAEARSLIVGNHALDPDDGLDTVLTVQDAVLPTPGRTYPHHIDLQFDVVAYFRQFLSLPEARGSARRLCTFASGSLVVEDPLNISQGGVRQPVPPFLDSEGWTVLLDEGGWFDDNNWELSSPIARSIRRPYM